MHRVPEGLTHEMPSGGQREGLLIPTLLDSPGQDPPPPHASGPGLSLLEHQGLGWEPAQRASLLCNKWTDGLCRG